MTASRTTPTLHTPLRSAAAAATLLAIAAMTMLTGCCLIYEGNDCPPAPMTSLRILFDWDGCPEASPEGMAVVFYPTDGSPCWRFDFQDCKGGYVELPAGKYNVVTFNDDTPTILLTDDGRFGAISASTPVCGLYNSADRFPGSINGPTEWNGETVRLSPDVLWTDCKTAFTLSTTCTEWTNADGTPGNCEETELTLNPLLSTPDITLTIKGTENLTHAKVACAWISGLHPDMCLSSLECSGPGTTYPTSLTADKNGILSARSDIFGIDGSGASRTTATVCFRMSDASMHTYTFDITDQLLASPDRMHMHATISGITLPATGETEPPEGFDVKVDGWTVIFTDLTDQQIKG